MSLYIASLNSGSNGNCYYIGNDQEAVLVDAGISCRETEKRMLRLGLSMQKVKAVFISHEHSDHIRGLEVIARKYKLPVYITPATLKSGGLMLESQMVNAFKTYEPVKIGGLTITPFPKKHDAIDPCSFVIDSGNTKVGVFTDIGVCCEHVIRNFSECHAAFLEANYDAEMLMNGNYPYYLKKRISGGEGHLSNAEALDLFIRHRSGALSHVLLSHLSRENNSPQLVHKLFLKNAGDVHVEVASRDYESKVFHITGGQCPQAPFTGVKEPAEAQLSLFPQ